jgi:putative ABC transport system permease protein
MIEVKNLCKDYVSKNGEVVHALQDLSIRLPSRGMLFILGKSGSGKSTLLNVLGGLDTFDSGDIIICGKSSKEFSKEDLDAYRNTYIGFIFQDFHLLEDFSVKENIEIALEIQAKKPSSALFSKLMEELEISELAGRNPGELSGGQKQRVAVARALIKDPKILFADEPTGNLDSNTGKLLLDYLSAQSKDRLIVVVTHDRASAEKYADRLIELKDGRIIKDSVRAPNTGKHIEWESEGASLEQNSSLTSGDLRPLNELLNQKGKITIRKGEGTHFTPTKVEQVSANLSFAPCKSSLPFDKNLKISAKHIKSRKVRLSITVLLIIFALSLLGLAQIIAGYDMVASTSGSFDDYNINNVRLKQGVVEKTGFFMRRNYEISEQTYAKIKSDLPDIRFLEYYPTLGLEMRRNSYAILNGQFNGVTVCDKQSIESLGFGVTGEAPAEGSLEVMITDYTLLGLLMADATIILPIDDPTKLSAGVLTKLNSLNVTSQEVRLINMLFSDELEEFIINTTAESRKRIMQVVSQLACGYYLRLYRYTFKISGIIMTGAEEFMPLFLDTANLSYTMQAMRLKFNRANYYHNLYVGKGFLEKLYENSLYSLLNLSYHYLIKQSAFTGEYLPAVEQNVKDYLEANELQELNEEGHQFKILYFHGYDSGSVLKENEVLVSENYFSRFLKTPMSEIGSPYTECPEIDILSTMGYEYLALRHNYTFKVAGVVCNKEINNAEGDPTIFNIGYSFVLSEEMHARMRQDQIRLTSLFFALPGDPLQRAEVIRYISDTSARGNQVYHSSEISEVLYLIGDVLYITKSIFRLASFVIGLFSIILLANFMVSAVYDKKREIGILRALGCTGKNISVIFLTQAAFIGLLAILGATIMIILGVYVTNILFANNFTEYFDTFMIKDLSLLRLKAAPFAIVYTLVGVMVFLATYLPIRKVSKLTPIQAIR